VKLYVFPDLKHFIYNTVTQMGGGVKICILRHLFSLNCWSENCFSWPRNWRLWLKWSSFRCLIKRDSPQCYQKGASDWPLFSESYLRTKFPRTSLPDFGLVCQL